MPRVSSGRWCYVTDQEQFDWEKYLRETGAIPAPQGCFRQSENPPENRFEPGKKLVMIDPRNQNSWCFATVIAVNGPRMRLRLDGVDNMNDAWKLSDADDIRSVAWAKERTNMIVPPLGFLPRINTWPHFLSSRLEGEDACPEDCFVQAPPLKFTANFEVGHKLEAVDPKNPSIICVATVSQVMNDRIRIELDGWRASFVFQRSSRDLFPVGWCAKAGISLQEPGPSALMNLGHKGQSNSQNSENSQNSRKQINKPRSRHSLKPQQVQNSPEVRKRRQSSDSSSVASKGGDQSTSNPPDKKISKTSAPRIRQKRSSSRDGAASSIDSKSNIAEVSINIKPVAVAFTDDDSGCDAEIGSPLRLIIDESTNGASEKPIINDDTKDTVGEASSCNIAKTESPASSTVNSISPLQNAAIDIAHDPQKIEEKVSIFFNLGCKLGPFLSRKKLTRRSKTIGPLSPSAAVQEMLSALISCATTTVEVLKLIGLALADCKVTGVDNALKALASSSSDKHEIFNQTSIHNVDDVWKLTTKISERLQCCPNLFGKESQMKPCELCAVTSVKSEAAGLLVVPANTKEQKSPSVEKKPSPGNRRDFEKLTNGVSSSRPGSNTDSPPPMAVSLSHFSSNCAVSEWSIDEVADFLARNPDSSLAQHAELFRKHEIDGKALLLLTSDYILKYMGLKLGPSLKLGHLIDRLRVTSNRSVVSSCNNLQPKK